MTIYISGPITGTDNFKERFCKVEDMIKELFPECEIVNPVTLCADIKNGEWLEYMNKCVDALCLCSHIHMMNGWEKSKGACVEYFLAKHRGMAFV